MLSEVQIQILLKFLNAEKLRYSEGVPSGIDNDLYKYHLKFLQDKGYIEKSGDLYQLTAAGKRLGNGLNLEMGAMQPFYVSVMDIVEVSDDGMVKYLVQKRKKHPDFGIYQPVCGKLFPGESVIESASRKLLEETGLSSEFEYIGLFRAVRKTNENELLLDQWFNVCYTRDFSGELEMESLYGFHEFASIEKLKSLANENLPIKNLMSIIERIEKKTLPFLLEDFSIVA